MPYPYTEINQHSKLAITAEGHDLVSTALERELENVLSKAFIDVSTINIELLITSRYLTL